MAKKPISEYEPRFPEEELEEEQQPIEEPEVSLKPISEYVPREEELEPTTSDIAFGTKAPTLNYRTGELTFQDEEGKEKTDRVDIPKFSDFISSVYSGTKDFLSGIPVGAKAALPGFLQGFNGIKRKAIESYFSELKGERPASWVTDNPMLFADPAITLMQQTGELQKYDSSPQYQQEIKNDLLTFLGENEKEYTRLQKKLDKIYKDADLGSIGTAAAQGFQSFVQQAPVLLYAGYTKNPYVAYSMLPMFAAQESGRSYQQARMEGLPIDAASLNANINGTLELITEAIPTKKLSDIFTRSYKKNENVYKSLARDGFNLTLNEFGWETVNGVLQEHNNTAFGLQTQLREVREASKDPLYTGPREIDVHKSIFFNSFFASLAGSGSSISARGTLELSSDMKKAFLELDQNKARVLARELETAVKNADFLGQAIDQTTLDILNTGIDGTTPLDPEDFLTNNYLNYQLGEVVQLPPEPEIDELDVMRQRKSAEEIVRPQDLEAAQKVFSPTTTEIDEDVSPEVRETTEDLLNDMEISELDGKINPISFQEINPQEKDAIKSNIVNSRRFNMDDFLVEGFTEQDMDDYTSRLRDFNEVESDNLSTSIAVLNQAGMPFEIIEDITFFGMIGNDERSGKAVSTPYAVYNPAFRNVGFTKLSGISYDADTARQTLVGLSTHNLNTTAALAHELGHHIDYGFFDYGESAHFDSPLFEIPEYEIATSLADEIERVPTRFQQRTYNAAGFRQRNPELVIKSGTKGPIIREAFAILNNENLTRMNLKKEDGVYFEGRLLEYPMSSYISYMHAIAQGADPAVAQSQLRFIKGEIFAQMHNLYYTNRSLLEQYAPETVKLIDRVNNEISVDGFGNKSSGILRAFRSPRAPRSVSVSAERTDTTTDRAIPSEGPAGGELAAEVPTEGRDDIRLPVRTRVGTTGQYVGAPEGVTTPQALGALRRKIAGLTQEGEAGRFWYEQSGQALLDVTNGDKKEADLLAQAIAITSPGTPVSTNMVYAVQAYNQYKAGRPINTGRFPQSMNKKLEDIFSGKEWGGRKTNSFYANIIGFIDPTKEQAVTTDLWMVRAFGYKTESPSPRQYDFVEQEVQRIANDLGWEPRQVQAAIWVAKKSQDEGTSPEVSKYDYSDALKENLAQISWESIPGSTTNHMPEVQDATYEQLQEYHVAVSKAFLDQDGNDIIAKELGLLTPGNFEAPGYFEQAVSPGTQTEAVLAKKYKAQKDEITALDPASQDLAEAYAAVVGILLKQDGVGYHKPFFQKNIAKKDLNGIEIDIGRALSETETAAIAEAMARESGNTEYNPIASPRGARLINFDYVDIDNIKFKSIVQRALDSVQFDNNEQYVAGQFAANTGYLGNNWEVDKNGEGYLQSIGRISPDLQGRVESLIRKIQPRIQEVDQDFSERYGWTRNESINTNYKLRPKDLDSESTALSQSDTMVDVAQEQDTSAIMKPEDSDMLMEVPPEKGSKPPPSDPNQNRQFTLMDENWFENKFRNFKVNIVNNFDPAFTVENTIKSQFGPEAIEGKRITDETDLYHGRVKTGVEKFERQAETLIKFIVDNGYTIDQYNKFIYNLHAPERNEYINSLREPGQPGSVKYKDRGSGIKTEDAVKYLKRNGVIYEDGKARAVAAKGKILMEAYNKYHKPIIDNTIKLYRDNGLVDQENLADWKDRYDYYVPLAGFAADTLKKGSSPSSKGNGSISQAFSVSGAEVKRAKGRTSQADFALEQTLGRASAAVIRSEKNNIVTKLANLAREFPNADVWEVKGKNKFMAAKPQWDGQKAIFSFKEDGKEKVVIIRNERLAKGMAGWDTDTSGRIMSTVAGVTRGLAMVNTVLDPEFMITNFARDFQAAGLNLAAEQELVGGRAEGLKILEEKFGFRSVFKNMGVLKRGETFKEMSAEDQKYYDAFKESGAETGYVVPPTIEKIQNDLNNMADMYKGTFKGNAKKAIQSVYKPIEIANTVVENGTRFTAFRSAIELQGGIDKVTPEQIKKAAILAKNLTINFNRKGIQGNGLNAMYMFFNASIQGSVNFFRGYGPGGLSQRKLKLAGGLVSIGFITTLYNLMSSPEDEDGMLIYQKYPDYKKKTNYLIMLATPEINFKDGELSFERKDSTEVVNFNGKPVAVTIPLPYGFNIFHNLGRTMAELMYTNSVKGSNITSLENAAVELADVMTGSFSPIGIAETKEKGFGSLFPKALKTGTPTIAKPIVELSMNENWFGAPIYPEQFPGDYTPKSKLRKRSDNEWIAAVTSFMNDVTGGNDYYAGQVDLSPQTIGYLVAYGTGGIGRTVGRTSQLVADGAKEIAERGFGEGQGAVRTRELNQIPFVRRLLAVPEDHVTSRLFYDAVVDVESYSQNYLRNEQDQNVSIKDLNKIYNARPNLLDLSDTIPLSAKGDRAEVVSEKESSLKIIKNLRKEMIDNEEYKKSNPRFYYKEQERIEDEILSEMKVFIKSYNAAIEKDKK